MVERDFIEFSRKSRKLLSGDCTLDWTSVFPNCSLLQPACKLLSVTVPAETLHLQLNGSHQPYKAVDLKPTPTKNIHPAD